MTQEPKIFPYIERLLQGAEVVWKPLGEVATFRRGSFPQPYTKSEWYGGDNSMPFVQVADMEDNKFNLVSITKQRISQLAMPKSVFVPEGTILVSLQGTIGRVAITQYDSYVDRTIAIFTHIDNEVDIRYFAYQLKRIFGIKKENARGSTIKTITKEEFGTFQIPLPPFSVQQEIVRILDKFTQLEAELEAELDCRKRQYEYYRNKLLTFNKIEGGTEIVWKTLGEVATYSDKRIKASSVEENNYIGVENLLQNKAGKIISNYVPSEGNVTAYNINDVLIGNIRPYLKKIWLADNDGGASGDVLVIHLIDNSVNAKYLYHILADDKFFNYNMKYAKGAKMPRGDKQKIMDYPIPLPPLFEQQRIATILDKFDTLVNSISEGLPKEIALRRKQYEYYREKLLTFANNQ